MSARSVQVERGENGSILMRNSQPLEPYPRVITERFNAALAECPGRIFLGERGENGVWHAITYAEAEGKVRALGQALLESGLSKKVKPLMAMEEFSAGRRG